MLRTPKVHQLVSRVETSMQKAPAQFAQEMHQCAGDEVVKLMDELAALGIDLQDIWKKQVSEPQLKGLATSSKVLAVNERVTLLDAAYHLYVDQVVAAPHTLL